MCISFPYTIVAFFIPIVLGVAFQSISLLLCSLLLFFSYWIILQKVGLFDLSNAVSLSLVVGIIASVVIYFGYESQYGVPFWIPGGDDLWNEEYAKQLIKLGYYDWNAISVSGIYDLSAHNSKGYLLTIEYMMLLSELFGDYSSMIPRVLNIFVLNAIGTLMVLYYRRDVGTSFAKAKKIYYSIVLFPNCIFLASHVYRDTIATFFIVLFFFVLNDKKYVTRKVKQQVLLVIICIISFSYRQSSILFLFGIAFISELYKDKCLTIRKKYKSVWKIAIISIMIVSAVYVFFRYSLWSYFLHYLVGWSKEVVNNESGNGIGVLIYSLDMFPIGWFLRIIYGLCSPFYTTIFDLSSYLTVQGWWHLLITVNTIVLVGRYIFLFVVRHPENKILYKTCAFLLFGILITTAGFRHYMMFYPFLLSLICSNKLSVDTRKQAFLSSVSRIISGGFLSAFIIMKVFF